MAATDVGPGMQEVGAKGFAGGDGSACLVLEQVLRIAASSPSIGAGSGGHFYGSPEARLTRIERAQPGSEAPGRRCLTDWPSPGLACARPRSACARSEFLPASERLAASRVSGAQLLCRQRGASQLKSGQGKTKSDGK